MRARLRLRRGELTHAEEWAWERQLSAGDDPSYLREYEHLTLARLLIARHRVEPDTSELGNALSFLERLRAAAERGGRGASVIEVLLLQALAHGAGRDAPAAHTALHNAVTLAQAEGYVRLFVDEGAPMAALLKALSRQPGAPVYARRLLAVTARTGTSASTPPDLVEPLSERELDVLRLLGGDLGGPDIARHLSVSLNTLRTHTKNIYAKLGVTSRRAAVRRGRDLNLIPGQRHS